MSLHRDIVLSAPSGLARPLSLPDDQNPVLVYLGGLAEGSRPTMSQALQSVADLLTGGGVPAHTLPWWQLRYQHVAKIKADFSTRYAFSTTNKILVAVRQVLRHCQKLGLMTSDEYLTAASVGPVRGHRLPTGRMISPRELVDMLAVIGTEGPAALRDRAILLVMAHAGLRRDEVAGLQLADYDSEERSLRVMGKGNKQREVPVSATLHAALDAWLAARGAVPGPLFLWVRASKVMAHGIGHDTVYGILRRTAERSGVKHLTPHDFRRTFVSTLLERGADLATVSSLAGHSQVQTTARYDRRGFGAKKKAVDLL